MGLPIKSSSEWLKEFHPDAKEITPELMDEYGEYYHFKKRSRPDMPPNILTKEEVDEKYKKHPILTVGRLKKRLAEMDLPDDGLIMIERVHDMYFEGSDISGFHGSDLEKGETYPEGAKGGGWDVYLGSSYEHHSQLEFNKKMKEEIIRRERGEEPEYPKIEDPNDCIIEDEKILDSFKTQYHPAWGICWRKSEKHLFIDLHY